MTNNFVYRLQEKMKEKKSRVMVGLDPQLDQLPEQLKPHLDCGDPFRAVADSYREFLKGIIEAVAGDAVCVKPQMACFEELGAPGFELLTEITEFAQNRGLLVVGDGKRNDIGHTASVYARTYLGNSPFSEESTAYGFDALTVNPYLGRDGIIPFVEQCRIHGRGIFVLVKTSNPASADLQDLKLWHERKEQMTVFEKTADLLNEIIKESFQELGENEYSPVGAVIGATYPRQLADLRNRLKRSIFLVPGYGAQGGGAEDVRAAFGADGFGAVVNSSRGINYAFRRDPWSRRFTDEDYISAARSAVRRMKEELNCCL